MFLEINIILNTVIHFYFGADLILVISIQAFLPKLNLYLNCNSGLTDAAACSKLSGSLSRYRNFLCTETANFRLTENCTLSKLKWITLSSLLHFLLPSFPTDQRCCSLSITFSLMFFLLTFPFSAGFFFVCVSTADPSSATTLYLTVMPDPELRSMLQIIFIVTLLPSFPKVSY